MDNNENLIQVGIDLIIPKDVDKKFQDQLKKILEKGEGVNKQFFEVLAKSQSASKKEIISLFNEFSKLSEKALNSGETNIKNITKDFARLTTEFKSMNNALKNDLKAQIQNLSIKVKVEPEINTSDFFSDLMKEVEKEEKKLKTKKSGKQKSIKLEESVSKEIDKIEKVVEEVVTENIKEVSEKVKRKYTKRGNNTGKVKPLLHEIYQPESATLMTTTKTTGKMLESIEVPYNEKTQKQIDEEKKNQDRILLRKKTIIKSDTEKSIQDLKNKITDKLKDEIKNDSEKELRRQEKLDNEKERLYNIEMKKLKEAENAKKAEFKLKSMGVNPNTLVETFNMSNAQKADYFNNIVNKNRKSEEAKKNIKSFGYDYSAVNELIDIKKEFKNKAIENGDIVNIAKYTKEVEKLIKVRDLLAKAIDKGIEISKLNINTDLLFKQGSLDKVISDLTTKLVKKTIDAKSSALSQASDLINSKLQAHVALKATSPELVTTKNTTDFLNNQKIMLGIKSIKDEYEKLSDTQKEAFNFSVQELTSLSKQKRILDDIHKVRNDKNLIAIAKERSKIEADSDEKNIESNNKKIKQLKEIEKLYLAMSDKDKKRFQFRGLSDSKLEDFKFKVSGGSIGVTKDYVKEIKNIEDTESASASLIYKLNTISSVLNMVGRNMGYFLRDAIKTQAQLEKNVALTNAIAKGDTTTFMQLKSFSETITKELPVSIMETTEAMTYLAQSGLNVNDIMKTMPEAMKMAIGTGSSLTSTLESIVTVINGFNMSFDEVPRVMDVFAKSANNSMATVEKLKSSFSRVSSFAEEANVSLETSTVILSKLYDAGNIQPRA